MKVLMACEFSGAVREAFATRGSISLMATGQPIESYPRSERLED